jgi:hypothetical protein
LDWCGSESLLALTPALLSTLNCQSCHSCCHQPPSLLQHNVFWPRHTGVNAVVPSPEALIPTMRPALPLRASCPVSPHPASPLRELMAHIVVKLCWRIYLESHRSLVTGTKGDAQCPEVQVCPYCMGNARRQAWLPPSSFSTAAALALSSSTRRLTRVELQSPSGVVSVSSPWSHAHMAVFGLEIKAVCPGST